MSGIDNLIERIGWVEEDQPPTSRLPTRRRNRAWSGCLGFTLRNRVWIVLCRLTYGETAAWRGLAAHIDAVFG